jgi:hypothetical protein
MTPLQPVGSVGQSRPAMLRGWPIGAAHNLRKNYWASKSIPAKKATLPVKEERPPAPQ